MSRQDAKREAYRIGFIGGVAGFVGGLIVTLPSLVSSGFDGGVVVLAIPIVLTLVLVGAWFPTVFKISKFGSSH